jgi:hypothetical protein
MTHVPFPTLPDEWEATRATLHAYSRALGALPQAHLPPHPKWWHISLKPNPTGLVTETIPLPDGRIFFGRLDLRSHEVILEDSAGGAWRFGMGEGRSGTEMTEAMIDVVAAQGLEGDYVRKDFESDEPTTYDEGAAATYWTALVGAERVFAGHRARVGGNVGPIQFWPHGFDLAFEWFGTRVERHEENGEVKEFPAQLNLGFYSSGDPYFYSTPWPFERDILLAHDLSGGARWNTEGWEGSVLPYSAVADEPDGAERLADFAAEVFEIASPTLLA